MTPTIQKFLEYWRQAPADEINDGRILANAHAAAVASLEESRSQTLRYITPINNGKAWVPGFDPLRIPEVAALAQEIACKEEYLKTICHDIEAFLDIAGSCSVLRTATRIDSRVTPVKKVTDDPICAIIRKYERHQP